MKLILSSLKFFKFSLIVFIILQFISTQNLPQLQGLMIIGNVIVFGYEMFQLNEFNIEDPIE